MLLLMLSSGAPEEDLVSFNGFTGYLMGELTPFSYIVFFSNPCFSLVGASAPAIDPAPYSLVNFS